MTNLRTPSTHPGPTHATLSTVARAERHPACHRRGPSSGRRLVTALLLVLGATVALGAGGVASAEPAPNPTLPDIDVPDLTPRFPPPRPRVTVPAPRPTLEIESDLTPVRPNLDGHIAERDPGCHPARGCAGAESDTTVAVPPSWEDLADPDRFRFDPESIRPNLDAPVFPEGAEDGDGNSDGGATTTDVHDDSRVDASAAGDSAAGDGATSDGAAGDGATSDGTARNLEAVASGEGASKGSDPGSDSKQDGVLAFTGSGDLLPVVGLGLIGAGGLVAWLATMSRRRAQA